MTRKDYVRVAAAMNEQIEKEIASLQHAGITVTADDEHMNAYVSGMCSVLSSLVTVFKEDNPRFSTPTFIEACGIKYAYYENAISK